MPQYLHTIQWHSITTCNEALTHFALNKKTQRPESESSELDINNNPLREIFEGNKVSQIDDVLKENELNSNNSINLPQNNI